MSEFFELRPGKYPPPGAPAPDEVLRGDWWGVNLRDGEYVLDYLSGELAGRSRQIVISKEEYERLVSGDADVEQVLVAHGAG